ncbi:MAG: hypothetical protein ACYTAN_13800 [Planctomycetota bacterium]
MRPAVVFLRSELEQGGARVSPWGFRVDADELLLLPRPAMGLVGWWRFSDGEIVADLSGNGNDLCPMPRSPF